MVERFSPIWKDDIEEIEDGDYVRYTDYDRLREALQECVSDMAWFVGRVDAGEVRSVKTYGKFKATIAKARDTLGEGALAE